MPLLLAASARPAGAGPPMDPELATARAEQAAAERDAARLTTAAQHARTEEERLRAEVQSAARAIEGAEAGISAADARLRLADEFLAAHRQRLVREQQPAASLLAGLAVMADRPPLLVLADHGSTDQLVAVRILLAATLPVVRSRTARISAEIADGKRLQQSALQARRDLADSRRLLGTRRHSFASLEDRAHNQALTAGTEALNVGDTALAAGEDIDRLRGAEANSQGIRAVARQLAAADPAPPRPFNGSAGASGPSFAYTLPASAPVTVGVGAVSASGVRSRGLDLATTRGSEVTAPADGIVRFAGPFRDYDGVLIVDHGGGWMTLIVNLASQLQNGDKVRLGDQVGRALGPIQVELSHNGRRISPALIAGSSAPLSKAAKGR
ncbi:MAG: peptidoglycan DD-metalloendopeptidase family protein [Sphingomicrobium sp.]